MLLNLCNEYQCHQVSSVAWVPVSGVGVKVFSQSTPIVEIAADFKTCLNELLS